ncbi:PPC domain-containing DNA-binding protein [Micromonospora sp. NPDC049523]|uniref:PPC domain-containing DNA-binding protein n=1 Tax=Micromonospora sp. NPDC049523 TaxID=3155921 RepID=UPI0034467547
MILISVQPGQEVMSTLRAELQARGVANGAVVSLIGAVEGCCISTMTADDYAKDILTEYAEPFELTGTGEVKDGEVHLHVVLGREGDEAKAGHLHWANVEHFFVNAYVLPL